MPSVCSETAGQGDVVVGGRLSHSILPTSRAGDFVGERRNVSIALLGQWGPLRECEKMGRRAFPRQKGGHFLGYLVGQLLPAMNRDRLRAPPPTVRSFVSADALRPAVGQLALAAMLVLPGKSPPRLRPAARVSPS